MEPALRAVCKDVRIGKILIQTNQDTGEPEVPPLSAVTTFTLIRSSEQKVDLVFVLLFNFSIHKGSYTFCEP